MLTCVLAAPGPSAANQSGSEGQLRDALCTFKPKSGAEETYAATVRAVSVSPDAKAVLMWVVKLASGDATDPGLLEQAYAPNSGKPGENAPMIGEANANISLQSMVDTTEGHASSKEKPAPTGFVIVNLELKLKSAAG
jgi:hypothetical protein